MDVVVNEERKYWVALSTHNKIGGRTFTKLFKRFKKLSKVWNTSERELLLAGLDLSQAQAVAEIIAKKDPDAELAKLDKFNLKTIILPDKDYPKLLKELPDPPGLLYIKGKIIPEDEIALAVVGSRRYSSYGKQATEKIVYPLAKNKLTIVSGLALGIDSIAHEVALQAKGRTVGVLGCGLDQIYPVSNIRLADKIIASGGAIISEFPLGMPALRYNFPIRNRIIAGLTLGTLVIECAEGSGSLLTASAALEYNREVFAVPGEIFSPTSEGTNRLIKMGAKMVTTHSDILEELLLEEKVKENQAREVMADTAEEKILLELLREPVSIDFLVIKSKLTAAAVNACLLQMEMKGLVKNLGGTRYVAAGKIL
jgi:DNA processing protein